MDFYYVLPYNYFSVEEIQVLSMFHVPVDYDQSDIFSSDLGLEEVAPFYLK